MKKLLVLAALLVMVILAIPAAAQEKKKLLIATDATWPPFEFVNEQKELTGLSVDYMKAAAKEGGYELEIVNAAWDGIFVGLINKRYDAICSSVTITEERKKNMDFSLPYFTVRQAVIVPKDSEVLKFDDLKGKRAGCQIGTTGHFTINKAEGVEARTYDEVGLAVEDLYLGRLAAVVCDDAVAANFILENSKYKEKLKIAFIMDTSDSEEFYGVAVRKGDSKTLELLNKGIEAVKAKGIDKEISKKWIEVE